MTLGKIWIIKLASICALLCLIAVNFQPASAYKIRPFPGVHEGMTLLAQRCLSEARAQPNDCSRFIPELAGLVTWRGRPRRTYDDLQKAVRWPDDPGRQIGSFALFNFLGNSLAACEHRVTRRPPAPPIDQIGILCSSHVGRLQFFHAMKASGEEDREETRAKILDWADLAYRLAIGDIPPSTTLCAHFSGSRSNIAASFEITNPDFCSSADAWTFATMFGWQCSNIVTMSRCNTLRPGVAADQVAVRNARGALLHLIQDSYSQSHAVRGPLPEGEFAPRVDCSLPTDFYSYIGQRGHGNADFLPDFAPNCRGGEVHDAITASAMALYHLERRTDPDNFNCYLQDRVFGRRTRWAEGARRIDCDATARTRAGAA